MTTSRAPCSFLALVVAAALWPAGAAAQGSPQQVYAIVVDSDGFPVRGLSSEDFSLRDGSVRQAVLGAEPATNPVWLAVVIRGFAPDDLPQVKAAVQAIAAMTTKGASGSRVGVVRATPARAGEWLDATTGISDTVWSSLLTDSAPVLDAIGQAAGTLRKAPTDRRAVILLMKRSVADTLVVQRGLVTDQLFNSGAALWTVEVPGSSTGIGPASTPANAVKLDDVLTDATKFSGSLRERGANVSELAPLAERVANLVLAQYVVTYLWPNPMLSSFSIATRHDRGDVLVPAWAR